MFFFLTGWLLVARSPDVSFHWVLPSHFHQEWPTRSNRKYAPKVIGILVSPAKSYKSSTMYQRSLFLAAQGCIYFTNIDDQHCSPVFPVTVLVCASSIFKTSPLSAEVAVTRQIAWTW